MSETRVESWNHDAGNKRKVFIHLRGPNDERLCIEVERMPWANKVWRVGRRHDFSVTLRNPL